MQICSIMFCVNFIRVKREMISVMDNSYQSHKNDIFVNSRYRNGQLLDLTNRTRYGGATAGQPSLVINAAHREDTGGYSCVLENKIGASESQSAALLDVYCKFNMYPVSGEVVHTSISKYKRFSWEKLFTPTFQTA